jgi:DNA-binding Lrp family transcriptional regulator
MVEIDLKDRKILYQLDLNCRQSNAQIGKKVGLSKQVVDYRIKRMEEDGVIINYYTMINSFKLGYNCFRIYINFHDINHQTKQEIIQYFCSYKDSWAVLTANAPIDLDVVVWVKNIYNFYHFWEVTLDKYQNFFSQVIISIYVEGIDFEKSFLLEENHEILKRINWCQRSNETIVIIDKTDYLILENIVLNARISIIEIANKIGRSSQSINYRIKNLIKNYVVQGFRVNINYNLLGLQVQSVDFYLKEHKCKKEIIHFIKENPSLFCINFPLGWSDFTLEYAVKDTSQIESIIQDIDAKFPNIIRKYGFWVMPKIHKERWLPEMTESDFKKQ